MEELLSKPWPWYIAGPLIGLAVPLLLFFGNKSLSISSSLRHICAAVAPGKVSLFQYEWKKEIWNLIFILGVIIGGFIAMNVMGMPEQIDLSKSTIIYLHALGLKDTSGFIPVQIFSWESLMTWKGLLFMVLGGFLVGFGTRYAGGCTSGHSIFGLSTLQWPSLVATICFMLGGFAATWLIIPHLF